jgi:hypothetical protein
MLRATEKAMVAKTTPKPAQGRKHATNGGSASYHEALIRHLAGLVAVEGVFTLCEDPVIHVYSVIAEHQSAIYKSLLRRETLVEKEHPEISFEFHTRVHQGRPVHRAVPFGATQVYCR